MSIGAYLLGFSAETAHANIPEKCFTPRPPCSSSISRYFQLVNNVSLRALIRRLHRHDHERCWHISSQPTSKSATQHDRKTYYSFLGGVTLEVRVKVGTNPFWHEATEQFIEMNIRRIIVGITTSSKDLNPVRRGTPM